MRTDTSYLRMIARLRELRVAQGLTLAQVEIKSRGKWKAVVVGSYERGTRKVTLERAVALCAFYGADLAALADIAPGTNQGERVMLDLSRLRELASAADQLTLTLIRLARWIATSRRDWNGQVLSIRNTDLALLEIAGERSRAELIAALKRRKMIFKELDRP